MTVEAVFSSTGTYFLVNPSFRLVKTSFLSTRNYFFIPIFFLLIKNIIEIWRKSNLKMNHIPAIGHQVFSISSDIF